jgi:hypothetical protein
VDPGGAGVPAGGVPSEVALVVLVEPVVLVEVVPVGVPVALAGAGRTTESATVTTATPRACRQDTHGSKPSRSAAAPRSDYAAAGACRASGAVRTAITPTAPTISAITSPAFQ